MLSVKPCHIGVDCRSLKHLPALPRITLPLIGLNSRLGASEGVVVQRHDRKVREPSVERTGAQPPQACSFKSAEWLSHDSDRAAERSCETAKVNWQTHEFKRLWDREYFFRERELLHNPNAGFKQDGVCL